MCERKVTVILPAKNEPYALHLSETLQWTFKDLGFAVEVLIAEVGTIAEAVYDSLQQATGSYIGVMDSNGTHQPQDLLKMFNYLITHDVDLVTGSRVAHHYPVYRKLITCCFTWLVRNLLKLPYRDPLTAFIIGKPSALQYAKFKGCKFALQILAGMQPTRVHEHPYSHREQTGHHSKMQMIEGFYLIKQIYGLWKNRLLKINVSP